MQATNVLTFTWEAATNHLTTLTKDLGGSLTTYTFQYDSLSRITQFCSAPTTCSNFYYEGDSDWLSHVTDYYGTLISHYYYANGKPFAVDLRNMWGGYDRDYYRFNWHGDVSAVMDSNGNGDGWNNVSPFGDNGNGAYPANPNLEQYYGYGGAWGYLYFYGVLGGTNTVRSVDLYYIHGRWWHPDMGIFLSPNEKGDYLFGGDGPPGQKPADKGWVSQNDPYDVICAHINTAIDNYTVDVRTIPPIILFQCSAKWAHEQGVPDELIAQHIRAPAIGTFRLVPPGGADFNPRVVNGEFDPSSLNFPRFPTPAELPPINPSDLVGMTPEQMTAYLDSRGIDLKPFETATGETGYYIDWMGFRWSLRPHVGVNPSAPDGTIGSLGSTTKLGLQLVQGPEGDPPALEDIMGADSALFGAYPNPGSPANLKTGLFYLDYIAGQDGGYLYFTSDPDFVAGGLLSEETHIPGNDNVIWRIYYSEGQWELIPPSVYGVLPIEEDR